MDFAEGDSTTSHSGNSDIVARFPDRKIWSYALPLDDWADILTLHFLWIVSRPQTTGRCRSGINGRHEVREFSMEIDRLLA